MSHTWNRIGTNGVNDVIRCDKCGARAEVRPDGSLLFEKGEKAARRRYWYEETECKDE